MQATIKNAKLLLGKRSGWGSFKHALMDALNIPPDQYGVWAVPAEWKYAFRRATGWSDKDTRRQLGMKSANKKLRPEARTRKGR